MNQVRHAKPKTKAGGVRRLSAKIEHANPLDMKVLLRNTQTGLFYAGPEQWTGNDAEAKDFEKTDLALNVVSESKLRPIEVLVRFDEPFLEIPLRIIGLGE